LINNADIIDCIKKTTQTAQKKSTTTLGTLNVTLTMQISQKKEKKTFLFGLEVL
jgi:cell division protein ZapA (FtsZ GTPase activity inhibitor)